MAVPKGYYTDPSGKVRPIMGKGRGSSVGAVVVVGALAVGMLGMGGAVGGAGGGLSIGSGSGGTVPRAITQARRADVDRATLRLQRKGLRVTSRLDTDTDCAGNSYGLVTDFLRTRPCDSLVRVVFEVRGRGPGVVLVAVSWVQMPDEAGAVEFHQLVDRHGTGNITELSRDGWRYRDVRFTGENYDSDRDGTTVVNAQAEPVGPGPGAAVLSEIVDDVLG